MTELKNNLTEEQIAQELDENLKLAREEIAKLDLNLEISKIEYALKCARDKIKKIADIDVRGDVSFTFDITVAKLISQEFFDWLSKYFENLADEQLLKQQQEEQECQ